MRVDRRLEWRLALGLVICATSFCLSAPLAIGAGASSRPRPIVVTLSSNAIGPSDGEAFAMAVLRAAPLPGGVTAVARPPVTLTNLPSTTGTLDLHEYFFVGSGVHLADFIDAHRPRDAVIDGPNSMTSGEASTTYEYSLPLANRHIAFESLDYTVGLTPSGREELRIDAEIDWAPIVAAVMPVKGDVTVTGYGKLASPLRSSSDAAMVTLNPSQALHLRDQILTLSNAQISGACMENSTLFVITVSPGKDRPVEWTATAEACPGLLFVNEGTKHIELVDNTCPFRRLISGLFREGEAVGTRAALKFCGPSSSL